MDGMPVLTGAVSVVVGSSAIVSTVATLRASGAKRHI